MKKELQNEKLNTNSFLKKEVQNFNENLLKWDSYFFNLCRDVANNSSCMSRKIGALLVKDKTIIGTGYNGPPRGIPHCSERYKFDSELRSILSSKGINPDSKSIQNICPRRQLGFNSGEGLHLCIAGHAERNTLINSARMGIKTKGCFLYMDCGIPCTPCLVEIINAGIIEIICSNFSFYDSSAKYLLEHCDLKIRKYSHLCEHKNVDKKNNLCLDCTAVVLKK